MKTNQKIISVFTLGILWGVAEILIGDLIETFSLPVRGIILTIVSVFFIITTKRIAEFRGSILLLGLIVVILKAVYYQNFLHSALLAVIILVVLAELIYIFVSDFKKASITVSTILLIYTFAHGIIMHNFFYGRNIFTIYENLVYGSWGINISIELILILFFIINLLIGVVAGYVFSRISSKIREFSVLFFE
ncbi:MAG: hypothetical protein U5K00_24435 [Melioribacteraceae bacterium]|nr:hypothetical protein [Melioribacteraceae bacterium]